MKKGLTCRIPATKIPAEKSLPNKNSAKEIPAKNHCQHKNHCEKNHCQNENPCEQKSLQSKNPCRTKYLQNYTYLRVLMNNFWDIMLTNRLKKAPQTDFFVCTTQILKLFLANTTHPLNCRNGTYFTTLYIFMIYRFIFKYLAKKPGDLIKVIHETSTVTGAISLTTFSCQTTVT